jgi:2-methylisocitrate lyase-like PEP mutase family enzyme
MLPGVYDGLSARLVEAMGFEAALISGAGLSESRLGRPDVGLLGLETNLNASRAMASVVDIPLLADGDTGYGNAVSVYHATQAFEDAAVAGVFFEDQAWPKRCGHMTGKSVIPAEKMVKKIAAAVDARRDEQFVIMARTDAAGVLGLPEAVRRGRLYLEAGADIVFPDALLSREDIYSFVEQVAGPICINMGFGIARRATTPLLGVRDMEQHGVAVAIYPRLLTSAAVRGMQGALGVLREAAAIGDVIEAPEQMVSFEEINNLVGLPQISRLDARYATEL